MAANMNPLSTPLFIERKEFLSTSQYWDAARLEAFQIRKLQHLMWHVQRNVPFYQKALSKEGLSWEDFTHPRMIRRLPLIDKKTIQADPDAFLSTTATRDHLIHRTTGGSTGTPLTVWTDMDFLARDKANTEHYMNVFGLDIFSHRSVRLYGDRIDDSLTEQGIYWRVEHERKLVMSPYHITRDSAALYMRIIAEHRPRYIHTRASAILPLARYALEAGLAPSEPIRHIFSDGEYLTKGQRRIIEQAFQARLVNIYGHTEGALVGHPCPMSDSLHFMPQVGFLELLDENGDEVTEPGAKGEMVGTGFNNMSFPLIRYQTGDIAVQGGQCCPCGRHYRLIAEVEGRIQDYVVDSIGNLVPLAPAVFNYNDMDWRGVREFKVVQERQGELQFLILPEDEMRNVGPGPLEDLCLRIGAILGRNFHLTARYVDSLPKTAIGKYRYLDQKLNVRELTS